MFCIYYTYYIVKTIQVDDVENYLGIKPTHFLIFLFRST